MEENNSNSKSKNSKCSRCFCQNNEGVFPPGFRFNPSDVVLVDDYLKKKIMKEPFPFNEIMQKMFLEVDIYKELKNPEILAEKFKQKSDQNEWFIFTPRDRKDKNGTRPTRTAGDGFWKATAGNKLVEKDGDIIGHKKDLVYHTGRPKRGIKTDWLMHEYTLEGNSRKKRDIDDMKLDDWVLCKIYKKRNSSSTTKEEEKKTSVVVVHHDQPINGKGSLASELPQINNLPLIGGLLNNGNKKPQMVHPACSRPPCRPPPKDSTGSTFVVHQDQHINYEDGLLAELPQTNNLPLIAGLNNGNQQPQMVHPACSRPPHPPRYSSSTFVASQNYLRDPRFSYPGQFKLHPQQQQQQHQQQQKFSSSTFVSSQNYLRDSRISYLKQLIQQQQQQKQLKQQQQQQLQQEQSPSAPELTPAFPFNLFL